MTEVTLLVLVLAVYLAWRPRPSYPCLFCHLSPQRREDCRQWCGAYREYRDYRKARRLAE